MVPGTVSDPDSNAVELGVKFRSTVAGTVTAVRFYKGSRNTGTHTGHLWSSTGALLGTVKFTNETSSGWQVATFSTPIPVQANTTYIVSYYSPYGHYSDNLNYFNSAVTNGVLTALKSGTDGPNGVYAYGQSGSFPNKTWNACNYWVDVVFVPSK